MAFKTYAGQKEFIKSSHYDTSGPITLDADKVGIDPKNVLAGTLLGKITSSGLGRARTATEVATALDETGSKDVVVDDASMFVVGDEVSVDSGSNNEITAIDYDANTLTLENAESDIDENASVKGTDGSQTAIGILMSDVNLDDGDVAVAYMTHGQVSTSKLTAYDSDADSQVSGVQFH